MASGDIISDLIKKVTAGIDHDLPCSKYDGYAGCWNNDETHRDSKCEGCPNGEKWSYEHAIYGTCYCCKCN